MAEGGVSEYRVQAIVAAMTEPHFARLNNRIDQMEGEMANVEGAVNHLNHSLSARLDRLHDGNEQLVRVQQTTQQITLEQFTTANVQLNLLKDESTTGFNRVVGGLGSVSQELDVVDGSVKQMSAAMVQMEVIRILNEAEDPLERAKRFNEEIEQRFAKAVENVYFVRSQYDQLIGTVMGEYSKKLRVIGDHIFAVYEQDFQQWAEVPLTTPPESPFELAMLVEDRKMEARSAALESNLEDLAATKVEPLLAAQRDFEHLLASGFAAPSASTFGDLLVPVDIALEDSDDHVRAWSAARVRQAHQAGGEGVHFDLVSDDCARPWIDKIEAGPRAVSEALPTRRLDDQEIGRLIDVLQDQAAQGLIDPELLPGYVEYLEQFGLEVAT